MDPEFNEKLVPSYDPPGQVVHRSAFSKLIFQIRLLMWKRYVESTKSKWDLIKVLFPPILFFVLLILAYSVFDIFAEGGLEPFLVPFAFWIFMQRLVVQIMYEKSSKLQESMRMMGLSDIAYWISYFVTDGVILGFILSFLCTIFTVGGLFNGANFGAILGLFYVFCLAAVPFCFFVCSFFDTPQTSGQALLALLFGLFVVYVVIFPVGSYTTSLSTAEILCCFVPPLALQIGCGAFLKSYDGIGVRSICGILVADIFIYAILAWYFSQVWPSKVGVPKPFYFPLSKNYWFPPQGLSMTVPSAVNPIKDVEDGTNNDDIPAEKVNETLLGKPTVSIRKLCKTFGSQLAVNKLSFDMYANQIFALLGHNGAGKTTTISMLTGLISPDYLSHGSGATIYGHDVLTDMDSIRYSMGVCPQHDVLFENLTVREHVLFFSQLKGFSYEAADREAVNLTTLFHLDSRLDHTGSELSGGQKRKLSVAIAVCGGSKFIVLDEPTAGMDPLARRELWDLLAHLRKDRTMLLTTHYMDEADVLGDRVGIMSLGQMQCMGTTQFLKTRFGAGYKLIFDRGDHITNDQVAHLTRFVQSNIPEAKYIEEDGAEEQVLYSLPFHTVKDFGPFFTKLESQLDNFGVTNFGVTITSLEDVFLKVGEDHTVTPQDVNGTVHGIGAERSYNTNLTSQIIGLVKRKLSYSINDFITIPLLLLPIAASIAAVILYSLHVITDDNNINDLIMAGMYVGAYLGAPGLIAEFIVRERSDKLRNVLTVMGCDFRAYWIGTFIADYIIMLVPTVIMWITWPAGSIGDYVHGKGGLSFFLLLLFNAQMIAFAYFFSFIFTNPKSCISLMPIVIIVLILTPNIFLLILIEIIQAAGSSISASVQGGILLWGTMIITPHGALFCALLDSTGDFSSFLSNFPPVGATIPFMIVEAVAYFLYAYYTDAQAVSKLSPGHDPTFKASVLAHLDEDVKAERVRTEASSKEEPLRIDRLRKVFPPKRAGQRPVVATEDICFKVGQGEIFGLLGANGAGKTTTLSMLTRHLVPTSGDAFIAQHSILSDFSKGASHLGVVTQNNSLWDRLSVESHLKLFARLRGVPEDMVKKIVDGTIDQLELTPHRHKLAMRLSGGMKRKLCVAIALIGDPEVVLLDEPSAGLDPVSRRNLWSVILRTMSNRAVILTTHSMDEAEALCKRIGIMVKGQLRALGTKQHLKNKFGSGFELTVKLHVHDLERQMEEMTNFVQQSFPSAALLAENGGLLTYQIPRTEMRMGLAFSVMETNKERLQVEDYTIAQPTLEQVFIRTVNKYADAKDRRAGTSTVLGGGARMSVEGTNLIEGEVEPLPSDRSLLDDVIGDSAVELNKCGCTNYFVKILIAVFALLTVIFVGSGIGASLSTPAAGGVLIVIAIIFLAASIISCSVLCCACCQNPKGIDE